MLPQCPLWLMKRQYITTMPCVTHVMLVMYADSSLCSAVWRYELKLDSIVYGQLMSSCVVTNSCTAI